MENNRAVLKYSTAYLSPKLWCHIEQRANRPRTKYGEGISVSIKLKIRVRTVFLQNINLLDPAILQKNKTEAYNRLIFISVPYRALARNPIAQLISHSSGLEWV
jgi:hypothetical protein